MEIFNEYYQLKSEYEEMEQERIQKIRNNRKLSKLEKRARFKKSKPLCIRCKQEGGTIFKANFNDDDLHREMTARCGNVEDPCDLYLFINCGSYTLLDQSIRIFEKDIENIKRQIVILKNKTLFGYKGDSTDEFDALKSDLNSTTSLLESNIRDIFVDDEPLNKLLELNYKLIDNIKELVVDGDFDDAVSAYIDQLLSNLKSLRETKYNLNLVLQTDDESFQLLQLPTTIASLEKELEEPTMTRTRIRVRNLANDRSETISETKSYDKENESENRVSELDAMVSQQENGEQEKEQKEVKFELTDQGMLFDEPEHQEIFNSFSEEYQLELAMDDDWLLSTMTEYAKTGKPYKFVPPPNLKIPPTLKPDGTYSFGNTIYNEEFAKLPNKQTTLGRDDLKTYMDNLVGNRLMNN
jgi:hypothetical protein